MYRRRDIYRQQRANSGSSQRPHELMKKRFRQSTPTNEPAYKNKANARPENPLGNRLRDRDDACDRCPHDEENLRGEPRILRCPHEDKIQDTISMESERLARSEIEKEGQLWKNRMRNIMVATSILMASALFLMGVVVSYMRRPRYIMEPTPTVAQEEESINEPQIPRTVRINDENDLITFLRDKEYHIPKNVKRIAYTEEEKRLLGDSLSKAYISEIFTKRPPAIFQVSDDDVPLVCNWSEADGCYIRGTNIIIAGNNPGTNVKIHEFIHYISWIHTHGKMKLNGNGSEYETIIPRRLNEGITELMTVHILDQKTRGVSYPIEARVAATIEFIATDDRVFRAYFSGDWIEVQKQVNTKLRPFAFDRMLILMANEDPGNMRAGEYEDPYACLPLEYLGNLIAEKRGLKREFFRTKNREIVWRRSEDMCR